MKTKEEEMKKIKKPFSKADLKQLIALGWSVRREKAKKRSSENSRAAAAWKLRQKLKLQEALEVPKENT